MDKLLATIEKYVLFAVIFLFPITVLGISPNPFVVPKLAVLGFGVALLLLVRSVRVIASGKLEFSVGNFDFPVFLLATAFLASAILRTPNKMEAFLLPGTATAIIGGALIYYLINQLKEDDKKTTSIVLFASAALFSVMSLLSFSGILGKIPQLPAFLRASGFTPEGGFLPAAIFLGVILPIGIGLFLSEKDAAKKAIMGVANVVVILGLAISVYNILPGRAFSPRFPSYGVSWSVSVDALKDSPILGVGPGNYLTAFNRFRPISYNQTDLWAIKFATARAFYFTALTEAGMLGFAGLVLLLLTLYRSGKKDIKETSLVHWGFAASAKMIALFALVVILALAPATLLLIVVFFILLALNAKTRHTQLSLTTQAPTSETPQQAAAQLVASKVPALLVTIPVIIAVILFGYQASRVLTAEYKFQKALDYLVANDAAKTYDTMREAIRLNPYVDRYHATFTRINLALANAIALRAGGPQGPEAQNQEAEQPSPITDQDRQNITLLVQQAIAEGKATVALNPLRAGNWEVLAQTYRAIMPLAQGADQFAIQTYRQSVALDPINPNLRIALGGVHYAIGDFESAVRVFELATVAKPDHANAHYNFAFALRDKGELNRAIAEMSLVLSLIPDRDSQDYQVAKKALEDMQAKKAAEAPEGKELTAPKEGEQILEPPLNLPEGSEPPEAPLSPTPTPTPEEEGETTITPQPTPTPAP